MWRNRLSVMLCALLALSAQAQEKSRPTVQEQVGGISSGTIVHVKTKLKDMKKVKGRLGTVTAEGFDVQTTKGQNVDTVKLNFADVKSVKQKDSGTSTTAWVITGAVIGALVLVVVALAVAASGW